MKRTRRIIVLVLVGLITLSLFAQGQQEVGADPYAKWPEKPVQFIAFMGAGGDTDFNSRTYAKYLEAELGKPVVVSNVSGLGGALGTAKLKSSAPDGYTFGFFHTCVNINEVTNMADYSWEVFDMVRVVGKSGGEAFVVRKDSPYNTLLEIIEASKKNPGALKIAANVGATSHWASMVLLAEHDAAFNIVNTGSSAERVSGLLGGHLDIILNPIGTVKAYLDNGDFKLLAVTSPERLKQYADIPTAKEQGVKLNYDLHYYVLAPKGTPQPIIDKLGKAMENVAKRADYAADIAKAYNQLPLVMSYEDSVKYITDERTMIMKYAPMFDK